jgi:hypothetical protein
LWGGNDSPTPSSEDASSWIKLISFLPTLISQVLAFKQRADRLESSNRGGGCKMNQMWMVTKAEWGLQTNFFPHISVWQKISK